MERRLITITGCVQGVGFRPFVFRLANRHALCGSISNTSSGVVIDVQGDINALSHFQKQLTSEKPKGAFISEIVIAGAQLQQEMHSFTINESLRETDTALALLPDTAMCPQCVEELFNPHNRRYQYPFLHCITCGPRFSLFLSMPFDRGNTTMSHFNMCPECHQEYNDPSNRRFFSQTNCCPACGPKLQLINSKGEIIACESDAIDQAIQLLKEGKIIASKSTGGYQLLVDATNDAAVSRLRQLKHRAAKPFAMLMPSLDIIKQVAFLCPVGEEALSSPAAPIVLLKKREGSQTIAATVSCESPYYGVMLPHNGIQHLLLRALDRPLVATSGNISGNPLCITEEEALSQLQSVVDAFLVHNRQIIHRLDDSIVHIIGGTPLVMRRARGYIPYAIPLATSVKTPLFAAGSHLKSSFAFAKNKLLYVSQHVGNLESVNSCRAYEAEVEKWEKLLAIKIAEGICDKHPDYYTTHYVHHRNLQTTQIQHHQAHVWAGMVDNHLKPPLLGISWDGTGWGDDATIWGGEAFLATKEGIKRIATFLPFRLPGGEKAVREPRRSALGVLYALHEISPGGKLKCDLFTNEEFNPILKALEKQINAPLCSSIGRLFDAVSALIGCCTISLYEGHAALALEAAALKAKEKRGGRYKLELVPENELWLIDWRPMVQQIIEDISTTSSSEIAWSFHEALAECIVDLARFAKQDKVLLTGGVMQNKLLVEIAIDKLTKSGFTPYLHRDIPPNDGGLAVGQLKGKLQCDSTQKAC